VRRPVGRYDRLSDLPALLARIHALRTERLSLPAVAVSLSLLGHSLRTLPLGTAYAVWTGIGAVGTVLIGVAVFGEGASFARLVCIGLIFAGIVGLKLFSPQ
jgi:quaternary ammonium compound-resistance protein SugE